MTDTDETTPAWQQKLCSVFEIARLMGVSKGRVSQYTNAKWFPAHVDKLGVGRIWDYAEVVAAWEAHKASTARHRPPADFAADVKEETS